MPKTKRGKKVRFNLGYNSTNKKKENIKEIKKILKEVTKPTKLKYNIDYIDFMELNITVNHNGERIPLKDFLDLLKDKKFKGYARSVPITYDTKFPHINIPFNNYLNTLEMNEREWFSGFFW